MKLEENGEVIADISLSEEEALIKKALKNTEERIRQQELALELDKVIRDYLDNKAKTMEE